MVELFADLFRRLTPQRVLVNTTDDRHQDHRAVGHAGRTPAVRIPEVLCYETPSTERFLPIHFVDIADFVGQKRAAMACHASQTGKPYADPQRIQALAEAYGYRLGRPGHAFEGF